MGDRQSGFEVMAPTPHSKIRGDATGREAPLPIIKNIHNNFKYAASDGLKGDFCPVCDSYDASSEVWYAQIFML